MFADAPQRFYPITPQELVERAPDVIIAVDLDENGADDEASVMNNPALKDVPAVRKPQVHSMLFNKLAPASPMVIEGNEEINALVEHAH